MRCGVLLLVLLAVLTTNSTAGQSRAARFPQFDYVAIEPPSGGQAWAAAINDRGVVAGTATAAVFTRMGTGFIWTESGGFTTIVDNAVVWDINNKTEVVGRYLCSDESNCAAGFIWSPSAGLRDLGNFFPYAVNDRGNMAGICGEATACAMIGGRIVEIAVGFTPSVAFGINDRNVVVGWTYRPVDDEGGMGPLAFTWSRRSGRVVLDIDDADTSDAYDVNNHGVVAGSLGYNGVPAHVNAATWTDGRLTIVPGVDTTIAWAINDRGWATGIFAAAGGSPFLPMLWMPGQPLLMLPLAGGWGGGAYDVNKSGYIVGYAYTSQNTLQAVMWRPR